MTCIAIKINPDNVDDVRLVIKGDVPQIFKLKNRDSVYKLNSDVWSLYYMVHSDHHEQYPLEIDGKLYELPLNACHAIMNILCDEWLGDFFTAEYPDGVSEDPPEFKNLSFYERAAAIEKTENIE